MLKIHSSLNTSENCLLKLSCPPSCPLQAFVVSMVHRRLLSMSAGREPDNFALLTSIFLMA